VIIAWATDNYKYALNTILMPKLFHIFNNNLRTLVEKLSKKLSEQNYITPTHVIKYRNLISSMIAQPQKKMLQVL